MQQALLNLVLNAEQAMKHAAVKRLELSAYADAACGAVVIAVKDTGHGIAVNNLARVFDPFFTTRGVGEGTGLGLSIAYGIVRDHGGQIWATSTEGVGTTFFVRLPVRARGGNDDASPVVVVAHGCAATRDFLAAALGAWGVTVNLARNGREALDVLTGERPGLVMLDAAFAGLDPQHWRETLAALRGRVKIVLLASGAGEAGEGAPFRDAVDLTLSPPYDLLALRTALVATLGDVV
jgi:CheY-like chemotaxis protein